MISHPHTFPFVFTHGKITTYFLPAVRRQASEDRAAAAVRPAPACALAFMQQGNGTALRCVPQTPPLCGARLRGRTRRRFLRTAVFVSAFSKTISQLTFFRIYVTILLVLPMVTSAFLLLLVYVFTIPVRLHKGTPVFLMQISQGQGVSITPPGTSSDSRIFANYFTKSVMAIPFALIYLTREHRSADRCFRFFRGHGKRDACCAVLHARKRERV